MLTFLFVTISCNENDGLVDYASDTEIINYQKKGEIDDGYFDIEEIRDAEMDELDVIYTLLAELNISKNLFKSFETVQYTDLPGKSFVLKYNEKYNENNKGENSLLLVLDEYNSMLTYLEHKEEKIDEDKSQILVTIEDEYLYKADMNNKTNSIINLDVNQQPTRTTLGGRMDCIRDSINACVDDSWCAFLCGITLPYCVSAIILACILR